MPLTPIAEQIRRRDFGTVRRGYDPQEVRAYLSSIARQVATYERELDQLRLEATSAAGKAEPMVDQAATSDPALPSEAPYDALSKRFAKLIEMADQEAERIVENARSEASRALSEAAHEADRIRVDAQAHAEETRQEVEDLRERAKTESDRVLSGLTERRRSLVTQLHDMREKLIAVAEDLTASVDEAVRSDARDAEVADMSVADEDEAPDDPRHEDLWAKKEESVAEIPDLVSIDLHLEERDE